MNRGPAQDPLRPDHRDLGSALAALILGESGAAPVPPENATVEAIARALLYLPPTTARDVSRGMIARSQERGCGEEIRVWVRVDLRSRRYRSMSRN